MGLRVRRQRVTVAVAFSAIERKHSSWAAIASSSDVCRLHRSAMSLDLVRAGLSERLVVLQEVAALRLTPPEGICGEENHVTIA